MASRNIKTKPQNQKGTFQKRILGSKDYEKLCEFINDYDGLPIDCEMDLRGNFPDIHRSTLRAILEMEMSNRLRSNHWKYKSDVQTYLSRYQALAKKNPLDTCILLNLAKTNRISPIILCRLLLEHIYEIKNKMKLSKMMRFPHLIQDNFLSANVAQCLCSDSQSGPLPDLKRRILGEEYEFKLKKMAKEAGLHFDDEKKLRVQGYDKTPDIKMILPFYYKGETINWIESKAYFGDIKSHKNNIQQQLKSYCNRFGVGIIIYWFGYHVNTPKLPDNSIGIIVLDDFPAQKDIELLDISENLKVTNIKTTKAT